MLYARNPGVARVSCHLLVFPLLCDRRRPDFDLKGLHDGDEADDLYHPAHLRNTLCHRAQQSST